MASSHDKNGRPIVVVTGMGVITSLGAGKADNWARLTAGESGIHRITRFANDGLKTTIAGSVDFIPVEPFCSTDLGERMATMVAEEAIAESGIGRKGDFPGPLFLAVAPVEIEWPHRDVLAAASGANDTVGYDDLLRASASGRFHAIHERCLFGSVAEHLADQFGTKGSPISVSTACASGASAIQLGVEAIRRGEADAALCIGTDGSVNPEALIRFSLLSALSTANNPPEAAAKPFAKNRDGFVMAEGAAALVLESYESAVARGANILGVLAGCGEMADSFHRTRSSPDGKPIIGCIRRAVEDAGLTPDDIDYINGVRRAGQIDSGFLEQVDDRTHAVGSRRGRDRVHAADFGASASAADHQLSGAGSSHPARRRSEHRARCQGAPRAVELVRFRRAKRLAGDEPGARVTHAGTHPPCRSQA
jgi:3-oxoacyl-[acyl-carrier-protein] synthase II